ncbi:MAG TPA: phosphohistidine phosphatase SixA [Spirochaetota bacterium]|nr:phosphohistidine phosphatase SixA [Spirochaetota bacterium]HRX49154.1 phosphohistidine phosphatase SixA [Spirochaetota bacterium]
MKTLYLFRHGDAKPDEDSDYNRELTDEGIEQTSLMADYLKTEGVVIDLIISSGAPRAETTAETIADKISYPVNNIKIDDVIYDAKNGDELLPIIKNIPEHVISLMIVGHNPVLSDLASSLINHGRKIDMSKSSVVKIDFDSTPWKDVNNGRGAFVFYKKPVKGIIETII